MNKNESQLRRELESQLRRELALKLGWENWRELRGEALARAMLEARWYVQPDDLIGGWCITVVDMPPSVGFPSVADFLSKAAAEHIVALHNGSLVEDGRG